MKAFIPRRYEQGCSRVPNRGVLVLVFALGTVMVISGDRSLDVS